ncbi:MAG: hypothetical protein JWN57_2734 [Frankiales bacterium]|jgi:GAF domain-containing protein/anti-sigma regulatory factor (Ser/Thr protein kinase)|nr:hypothetical protein [Frankiales bacterium]
MPSVAELSVGAAADAAPRARHFVTSLLVDQTPEAAEDAGLIVTELVTNAALHGTAPVLVRVSRLEGRVRVEVEDGGQSLPVIPVQSNDAMTGRGLRLVAALAQTWGVQRADSGRKTVWAELPQDRATVPAEEPAAIDVDAFLAGWHDDDPVEQTFRVRLGAVPTDLLLEAKAHIDNVVREARLAQAAADVADGAHEAVALDVETLAAVTRAFASARDQIKRQALAAAAGGHAETTLVLTQPASAADAGERYLAALDRADQYARSAQILTLEAPPVHKVFRRWYVQALVDQIRARAAGQTPPAPRTFLQVLAEQMSVVSGLQDAADRLELLQTVAADLTAASTVEQIAAVVIGKASEVLGALAGRVLLLDGDVLRSVVPDGTSDPTGLQYAVVPMDADLPGPRVVRTRRPLLLRNRAQLAEQFPGLADLYDSDRTLHAAPLIIGDHVLGVLSFTFATGGRLDPDTQARFVRALADALAQALERALALQQAHAANERLAYVADASVALSANLDVDATVATVGDLLVPRLADWCVVQVLQEGDLATVGITHADPDALRWAQRMSALSPVDLAAPAGPANVLRTGVSELYPDVSDELLARSAGSAELLAVLRQVGMVSAVVAPMVGRHGILGTLTLTYAESGRRYSSQDLPFVEDVARRAALALETAQLLRRQAALLAAITDGGAPG